MIGLASMPRSIASRVRRGRRSTAMRRRSAGSRSRRLTAQGIPRRGARRSAWRRGRNGGCNERRGRLLVAAFGDAGHAFPAIALARALRRADTRCWSRRGSAGGRRSRREGLGFTAAEEYKIFPPPAPGSADGRRPPMRRVALLPLMEEIRPDVVVSDILTLAPALAAEKAGVPRATLIPHVYPVHEPGMPFFAFGAQPPRTPLGRRGLAGVAAGADERAATGPAGAERDAGGRRAGAGGAVPRRDQRRAGAGGDVPAARVPAALAGAVHVTGPMEFELPVSGRSSCRRATSRWCWWRRARRRIPELRLVRAALEALAEEPVRVVATTNRPRPGALIEAPANAVVVDWLSYSQVMPQAALVVCHGGHGTVARALGAGRAGAVLPGGRGHGGERGAGGVGGRRADRCRGGCWRAASVRWAARRDPRPTRASEARASEIAAWASQQRRRRRGARSWSSSSSARPNRQADHAAWPSSGGGTRTRNPSVNSRMLCQLSYPGPRQPFEPLGRPASSMHCKRDESDIGPHTGLNLTFVGLSPSPSPPSARSARRARRGGAGGPPAGPLPPSAPPRSGPRSASARAAGS